MSPRGPVTLRNVSKSDLDTIFAWQNDADAIAMAAFTRADPSDRSAFDAHHARIMSNPDTLLMAIERDGRLVGTIGSFWMEGDRELTYWVDPAHWGEGIASGAVRAFLGVERTRPLFGRAAEHNVGSLRVLARAGFLEVGRASGW